MNYFGVLIILVICETAFGGLSGIQSDADPEPHWSDKRSNSSRALGFKPKNKNRTTTTRPTWRPKQNGKLLLAKQKGLQIESLNEIPADDPEFIYSWPDDYYDSYDFEHRKNMLQHGTFEARIQNYYKAELAEALANLNSTAAESNSTDTDDVSDATDGPSDAKLESSILLSTIRPREEKSQKLLMTTQMPEEQNLGITPAPSNSQGTKSPEILNMGTQSPQNAAVRTVKKKKKYVRVKYAR